MVYLLCNQYDKMKILWFTGGTSLYANKNTYNGGGWVASLQQALINNPNTDVVIEVAFPWHCNMQDNVDGVVYYSIKRMLKPFICYNRKQKAEYERIKEVVDRSKPDIIHVFGTELSYGMVSKMTDIPVVIHLQGILGCYKEFWLPAGLSWMKYFIHDPRKLISQINLNRYIKREFEIFQNSRYLMGRTCWDRSNAALMAPQATYFYCSEMLRPYIYNSCRMWQPRNNIHKVIVSVISPAIYKGGDVILKTAEVLKKFWGDNFEWQVYGIDDLDYMSRLTDIKLNEVNVSVRGVIDAKQLVDVVMSADVFVHPSYIENSPNTVCEAQVLGIPVIATNVGGVSSLITDMEDGILVPSHDIYMIAAKLKLLLENVELSMSLGEKGRKRALLRHSPKVIVNNILDIYNKLVKIR